MQRPLAEVHDLLGRARALDRASGQGEQGSAAAREVLKAKGIYECRNINIVLQLGVRFT